jgi:uncharacterized protein (TIGR03083 family)
VTAERPLPAGVRARVLDAAREARTPGVAVPSPERISTSEALRRAADSLDDLLLSLSPEQWRVHVLRDLDVQGLVGHLIGVEYDVQQALRGDASVGQAEHVASTQSDAVRQAGRPPSETRGELHALVETTIDAADGIRGSGAVLALHGMQLPLDDLLVVRAFELWTHENDIRTALELPPSVPDPSTLALMTRLAVQLLPHGAIRAGSIAGPVDLHLVLLGSGGGTWDVPLKPHDGDGANAEDVVVVVDAVDFCRLVANRVDRAELELHVMGDRVAADGVLAAAAALALD